jgi:hypothetical protein
MQRHTESSAHLGRFDPDWVRAHERLVAQQRLRADHRIDSAPWWMAAVSMVTGTARPETEQ